MKARSASLDHILPDPSTANLVSYRFIVRTDSRQHSGTWAQVGVHLNCHHSLNARRQVFLYMFGTENDWTSINLRARTKSPSTDGFPRGSIRTFCLKGPEIGQLHHLNVNVSDLHCFLKCNLVLHASLARWRSFGEGMVSERNRDYQSEHVSHVAMWIQLLATEKQSTHPFRYVKSARKATMLASVFWQNGSDFLAESRSLSRLWILKEIHQWKCLFSKWLGRLPVKPAKPQTRPSEIRLDNLSGNEKHLHSSFSIRMTWSSSLHSRSLHGRETFCWNRFGD